MAKFSCLISCFYKDSALFLEKALISLTEQTKLADEIIFVEDGPLTSDLYAVLAKFENLLPLKRITVVENKGLGNALDIGLKECSYDIVIRMDTDDICASSRFEKQLKFLLENPAVDIVGTWAKDIDENENIIGERKYPISHQELHKLMWTNPLIHPAVAFRRSAIIRVGSYDPKIVRRQDYDLWIRAAHGGLIFANIPEFLLYYRFTPQYYKKNNLKVTFKQAVMGAKGAYKLRAPLYVYFAVFAPVLRTLLPKFLRRPIHKLMSSLDPRSMKEEAIS